jgi:transposase
MIADEQVAQIRHLFHAEHWKIGTIAAELHLHPDTVRAALETDRFRSHPRRRDRLTDPYLDFLRQTLQQYPRLRATRLFQMIHSRGYPGSINQLRRVVAELRPPQGEAFLRLRTFPGEQAQADWAHFGEVTIGRARRRLSGFVLTSPTAAFCGWSSSSTKPWRIFSSATSMPSPIGVGRHEPL